MGYWRPATVADLNDPNVQQNESGQIYDARTLPSELKTRGTPAQLADALKSGSDLSAIGFSLIDPNASSGLSDGRTQLQNMQKVNPGGSVVTGPDGKKYWQYNPGSFGDAGLSGQGSAFGDFLKSPVGLGLMAAAGGGILGGFGDAAGIASGAEGYASGTIAGDAALPGALAPTDAAWGVNPIGGNMGDFNFSDFFNLPGSEVTDPSQLYNPTSFGENGGYGDAGNYGDSYNWQNPASPGMGTGGITDYLKQISNFLPKNPDGSTNYAGLAKLLGPLAGGILGGIQPNGKPAGTTTTIQDIPDWQKPFVMGAFGNAGNALGQSQGMGYPLLAPAANNLMKTINGDFLSPGSNPWLDSTFQRGANAVGANIDSRFEGSGSQMNGVSRFGSGAHFDLLNRGLNDLATQIYGGNYQTERARQANASINAPQFSSNAAGVPFAGINDYASIVGKNYGGQTQTPYFTNTAGGILSGALAGGALSGVFK